MAEGLIRDAYEYPVPAHTVPSSPWREKGASSRAAENLLVSQPALSQTIIQLEETLGFPVFERTTRSVTLTEPGERLLAKARALSQSLDVFNGEASRCSWR